MSEHRCCDACPRGGSQIKFDPVGGKDLCDRCWVSIDPWQYGCPQPPPELIPGARR